MANMTATVATPLDEELEALRDGAAEAVMDTGLLYRPDHPVRVRVRLRDGRYDMSDGAAALNLAGRAYGWFATMEQVVAERGMNVNRRGVVLVTGFAGRDLRSLAMRFAECSRVVYSASLSCTTIESSWACRDPAAAGKVALLERDSRTPDRRHR